MIFTLTLRDWIQVMCFEGGEWCWFLFVHQLRSLELLEAWNIWMLLHSHLVPGLGSLRGLNPLDCWTRAPYPGLCRRCRPPHSVWQPQGSKGVFYPTRQIIGPFTVQPWKSYGISLTHAPWLMRSGVCPDARERGHRSNFLTGRVSKNLWPCFKTATGSESPDFLMEHLFFSL